MIKYVKKYKAFTLAEILITIAAIGIIAAITIPSVIQDHRNSAVEAKLKKIYVEMNEVIYLSEYKNGDSQEWTAQLGTMEGLQKYILPYLKTTKVEDDDVNGHIYMYLPDGSVLAKRKPKGDKTYYGNWTYITRDTKECKERKNKMVGICAFDFYFRYSPNKAPSSVKKIFEPYDYGWDGTEAGLMHSSNKYGCDDDYRSYCTKLIQYNGWKIPDNYPHKVR